MVDMPLNQTKPNQRKHVSVCLLNGNSNFIGYLMPKNLG